MWAEYVVKTLEVCRKLLRVWFSWDFHYTYTFSGFRRLLISSFSNIFNPRPNRRAFVEHLIKLSTHHSKKVRNFLRIFLFWMLNKRATSICGFHIDPFFSTFQLILQWVSMRAFEWIFQTSRNRDEPSSFFISLSIFQFNSFFVAVVVRSMREWDRNEIGNCWFRREGSGVRSRSMMKCSAVESKRREELSLTHDLWMTCLLLSL